MSEQKSKMTTDLTGKTALVTGASRGLGQAIALTLAANGAAIACVSNEPSDETASMIREAGGTAECWICDVSDSEQVNDVVKQAVAKFKAIDILVNNAGVTQDNMLMRMSDEQWDLVLNVNLKGTFLFTRAIARPMIKQRGGRIVNIASVSGLVGNAGQANYSASKAGVVGLTRTTAKELAGRGVTANAVAPGFIESDMTKKLDEKVIETAVEHTLLKRVGQPQDIADAVLFLASDAASYITGQVLTVDGGMTL